MKSKAKTYLKTTDFVYPLICLALSVLSVMTLFSVGAYGGMSYNNFGSFKPAYTQIFAAVGGMLCALIISCIDIKKIISIWPLLSIVCWSMVLLTFVPGIGYSPAATGSQSWIPMPFGMSFQPSEIAKISFYISFSAHLTKVHYKINSPRYLLPVLLHMLLPVLLLHFQGDDGAAMVFLFTGIIMLIMAGLNRWCVTICGALGLLGIPVLWKFVLTTHQKERILGLFNPYEYEDGIMYQQIKAREAVANGGFFGTGLFGENHSYIPRADNDFIFAYFAESCGFLGSIILLLALCLLMAKIAKTALYQSSGMLNGKAAVSCPPNEGAYICTGIFATLFIQTLINVAMNLMLLPVMGLTLPFISAGGTSVLMLYISIGLVMSIERSSRNRKMNA